MELTCQYDEIRGAPHPEGKKVSMVREYLLFQLFPLETVFVLS